MKKLLFETKVKDGLFLLAVLLVVAVTSLSLDDMQGALRKGKIAVTIYVPSYEAPSDGPVLKPGDPIKIYKKVVGRVLSVDFFVAAIKKPLETDAGPTPSTTGAAGLDAAPPARPSTLAIVTGLKVHAELFKGDYAGILSMVTLDSTVRVESQTLGESAVLLMLAQTGEPIGHGGTINFPRNHASLVDPKDPASRFGRELSGEAEVVAIRRQIAVRTIARPAADPDRKAPSDDF